MASGWIFEEVRRVLGMARTLHAERPEGHLWVHYRRGQLAVSRETRLEGFEPGIRLPLPMGKTESELMEWMVWELRSVPCHPEK